MNRVVMTRPTPARFAALVAYVPRACLAGRRRAALLIPMAAALLFGALTHAVDGDADWAFAGIADRGLFGLVLPLGTLIIGDAVLGAEVRNGALSFTWLAPIHPAEIAIARWTGGTLIALGSLVPACLAAALIASVPEAVGPLALATLPTVAASLAVFVFLGAATRRAAVWSLGFVLLVERLLGGALSGVAGWSPTWLGRAVYASAGPSADALERGGIPEGGAAIGRLTVVIVAALGLAAWRLGRLRLTGARD